MKKTYYYYYVALKKILLKMIRIQLIRGISIINRHDALIRNIGEDKTDQASPGCDDCQSL